MEFKKFLKPLLVGMGVCVLAIILLEIVTKLSFFFTAMLGLVIGFIVAATLVARSRGERPSEVVKEAVSQAVKSDPGADERLVREQVIQLNQDLRLLSEDEDVVCNAEKVIDAVLELVPRVFDPNGNAGSSVKIEIRSLSSKFLPDFVRGYLRGSAEFRESKRSEFLDQMQKLSEAVAGMSSSIDRNDNVEFEVKRRVMKAMMDTGMNLS
ncbi:hypothetical protein ACFL08_02990 [Patescibacteria group bacterium]